MNQLTFFTKPDCPLCDAAWFVIEKVCAGRNIRVEKIDIAAPGNERWFQAYRHDIPVIHLDGREIFRHRVVERELRRLLAAHS